MSNRKDKFFIALICIVVIYLGGNWAYGEAAQKYFEKRCEEDAGEFIYRTVENVEGLFQMRPRDPRDYFTRIREGNIPEDPYGHTNMESQSVEGLFVYPYSYRKYYQYLETTRAPNAEPIFDRRFPKTKLKEKLVFTGDKFWRYTYDSSLKAYHAIQIPELKSQYGYTWREVINEQDKKYGVIAGELIVKELTTDEVLGTKRGFFIKNKQTGDMTICPKGKSDTMVVDFISKVLIPAEVTQ